jgi:GNAT superfamily N-acetyltransferase
MYSRYREHFRQQYERQEGSENVMLVAEAGGFPVGRLRMDVAKRREDSVGILWAFAVQPPLQNLGIGTRLMIAAEEILRSQGLRIAEIGAGKDKPCALRLYERLAYRVIQSNLENRTSRRRKARCYTKSVTSGLCRRR